MNFATHVPPRVALSFQLVSTLAPNPHTHSKLHTHTHTHTYIRDSDAAYPSTTHAQTQVEKVREQMAAQQEKVKADTAAAIDSMQKKHAVEVSVQLCVFYRVCLVGGV